MVVNSSAEADLEQVVEGIRSSGGQATYVVGDVADLEAMKRVATTAVREFGGIDTWINNAGVSIYGRIEDVGLMDARRLFETNYWGVVHGTLAALPHLKERGGALVNLGSVLSETGYPLQGHYTASKHAVKGFTDSLRLELEAEGVPVSVTLIQPTAIDTPYPEHAKSYLGVEPTHMPPVYAPEVVARAILGAPSIRSGTSSSAEGPSCSTRSNVTPPGSATASRRPPRSPASGPTARRSGTTRCSAPVPATRGSAAATRAT